MKSEKLKKIMEHVTKLHRYQNQKNEIKKITHIYGSYIVNGEVCKYVFDPMYRGQILDLALECSNQVIEHETKLLEELIK
jgi:hypothetical protein